MKKIIFLYIFFFYAIGMSVAQENAIRVTGVILDEFGETLPGVNAFLKDRAGVGVTSDLDGRFNLRANKGDVVVFSFIGYKRKELVLLQDEEALVIHLEPDSQQMDEVVVEAFGIEKRRITATGAITSVDVATLQSPATSLSNMLAGRVAGVIALQSSGEPGKNMSEFWIRGIGTFGANSSALVLIDGLEGSLDNIDPADIESFSVLKDASATAMYGVRGANGVVIVNTKRGLEDKLHFTFRTNLTFSSLRRTPDYLGGYDYAKLANEARAVRGDERLYSDLELDIIKYGLDPDFYPDVNWRDEILKNTSFQQTYYASVRGGGSIARYFLSLNMSDESAIYKQDKSSKYFSNVGYNKYGFRANIDLDLTKTTRLYFGTDATMTRQTLPGNADTDLLWDAQAQLTPVLMPTVYSDGRLPSYSGTGSQMSPYVLLNHTGKQDVENFYMTSTLKLDQDLSMLIRGLRFSAQGALTSDKYFKERRYIVPELWLIEYRTANNELAGTRQTYRQTTEYWNEQNQYRKYYFQSNLTYSTAIADKNYLSLLVHYEMSDLKKTEDIKGSGMKAIPVRYQGISSRVSYNYDDTYLLDFNFGYTGSENFQPGKRFGFFPSVSGGWVPSSYQWTKENLPWIDYFKIRGSYGLVGNDRIVNDVRFPYLTSVNTNASTGWGYIQNGISESYIGADNLEWEKSKKMDLGIEGSVFNKKFEFEIDFFKDIRDGIFQERKQVPDFIGLVNMPYGNVGSMKSWGSDGNVTFHQKVTKDLNFLVRANFTYAANKVNYFEEADTKYEYTSATGRPHGYQGGYISLGLFRDEEEIANSPTQSFGTYMPGDIKYKDVNGDGVINEDDKVPLSFSNYPRLVYGFGLEVSYKKLTVSALFKGTGNTTFYHVGTTYDNVAGKYNMGYIPFYQEKLGNVLSIVNDPVNRWIPKDYDDPSIPMSMRENPNARFPRLSYGNNANNSQLSDFWKANSRYLRLQEVNIAYKIDHPAVKKIGINSIDVSLVGTNLAVWDDVKIFDPEQAAKNGRVYPIPARYTFQLYINF